MNDLLVAPVLAFLLWLWLGKWLSWWLVFKSLAWETRPFGDGSVECSADGRSCCDVIMARSVTFDVLVAGLWCAKRRCEEALRTSICYANVSFVALGVAHALDHWRVRLSNICPYEEVWSKHRPTFGPQRGRVEPEPGQ